MEKKSRIVRGRTEIYIPSNADEVMYLSPAVGPNSYQGAGEQILKTGFVVPTGDLIAPLVREAYCGELKGQPEFTDVRDRVQHSWLWVFNINLWTENGIFSLHDLKAVGRSMPLSVKTLERKLEGGSDKNGVRFSEDGTLRFAPRGSYGFGEMSSEALAKDGAMIADYGVEGAKLLAEASATRKNKPKTYGSDIQECQAPQTRVSALLGDYDSQLRFGGFYFGDDSVRCAFPVRASFGEKIICRV